jgi:tetratricopeptide (TPR) repeat protein
LFGKFYGELAAGQSLGIALANARQDLYFEQQRGLRWRGTKQIELELADWFLPAWYQAGGDITLLKKAKTLPQIEPPKHRLPAVAEEGFFGRSRELWQIERAFVQGTRRMTIAGFGGQGKTYLAVEAGRWLSQTGMFDTVCFVDYAAFQGVDAVSTAVSEIGCVLEQSFIDAAAVTKALSGRRTLIILDNLESLTAETLQELLTEANKWSQVGATRLLLTTRDGGLSHADYPAANSLQHQLLPLSGLGNEDRPEDALRYFQGLMKLPPVPKWDLPERAALIELFKLVDFHPLSIKLVAYQLKERRVGDLARSLEQLLAAEPQADKQRCLIASLNLSLQRLDKDLLELLPRLGVFQGGALEFMIFNVLQFELEQWQRLILALERTGLIQIEIIENIASPFFRFHPTLAPVLWSRLSVAEQLDLRQRHQQHYYGLVSTLYNADTQNPHEARSIARRELSNLLWAVQGALEDRSKNAIEFVDRVSKFLYFFGLERDRVFLTEQLDRFIDVVGSNNWYLVLSKQGDLLLHAGEYDAAATIFIKILQGLGSERSFNRVNTLGRLGQCFTHQGQLSDATQYLQEGLNISAQLGQSQIIIKQRRMLQMLMGDVLMNLGEFNKAQTIYLDALDTAEKIGDIVGAAIITGQMGILAMNQGDLSIAAQRYKTSAQIFQQLQEPAQEATSWYLLGIVCTKGQQWEQADRACRESAKIREQRGDVAGAAETYAQLAVLNVAMNKPTEAEAWYRKALQGYQAVGDKRYKSVALFNLANLLTVQPNRLIEAKQLAEEALAIQENLDSAAVDIQTTYNLLAEIANAQGETDKAKEYRQLALRPRGLLLPLSLSFCQMPHAIELW